MTACSPWLGEELNLVRPNVLVRLGATAAKALLGSTFRVTASRGEPLPWPDTAPDVDDWLARGMPPGWVVATPRPSAVLRSKDRGDAFAGLVSDLSVARGALSRPTR